MGSRYPLEESLSTLDLLITASKVRYLGLSNFVGWQLQKAVDLTRQHDWEPIISLPAQYSLLCRTTEWELAEVCRHDGLGLMAWAPLAGGWLTGQIQPGQMPPQAAVESQRPKRNDRNRGPTTTGIARGGYSGNFWRCRGRRVSHRPRSHSIGW